MCKKITMIALAFMLAGVAMANPIKTDSRWNNRCDLPYSAQSLTHEIPAGGTQVTDEELDPISLTRPIPAAPTPAYDWFWFVLKVTRWAD